MRSAALAPTDTHPGDIGVRGYRVGVLTAAGNDELVIRADGFQQALATAADHPDVIRVDTIDIALHGRNA